MTLCSYSAQTSLMHRFPWRKKPLGVFGTFMVASKTYCNLINKIKRMQIDKTHANEESLKAKTANTENTAKYRNLLQRQRLIYI